MKSRTFVGMLSEKRVSESLVGVREELDTEKDRRGVVIEHGPGDSSGTQNTDAGVGVLGNVGGVRESGAGWYEVSVGGDVADAIHVLLSVDAFSEHSNYASKCMTVSFNRGMLLVVYSLGIFRSQFIELKRTHQF